MYSGYGPWKRFEADYFAGRKEAYQKEKNRIAQILIERAEAWVIPGLRSMIEVMDAATPLTNVRYTKNHEGAIVGYENSMDNSGMNRIKNRTPIKGLYLAGHWGNPGGGFVTVMQSGRNTFNMMMEDWGQKT
jgi:prolycopene isomerase